MTNHDSHPATDDRDVSRWEEDSEEILGSHRLPIRRPPGERVIIPRARADGSSHVA
jgi:hypothetical protein